jgi:hypothetical protein
MTFVAKTFPGATLKECHRGYLRYQMAQSLMHRQSLSAIFKELEAATAALGLEDYSVSQTSLDEVFCNFAAQQDSDRGATAAKGVTEVQATLGNSAAAVREKESEVMLDTSGGVVGVTSDVVDDRIRRSISGDRDNGSNGVIGGSSVGAVGGNDDEYLDVGGATGSDGGTHPESPYMDLPAYHLSVATATSASMMIEGHRDTGSSPTIGRAMNGTKQDGIIGSTHVSSAVRESVLATSGPICNVSTDAVATAAAVDETSMDSLPMVRDGRARTSKSRQLGDEIDDDVTLERQPKDDERIETVSVSSWGVGGSVDE